VSITSRVPTIGIPGTVQWEAHIMAAKNMKPMKELMATKPKKGHLTQACGTRTSQR
jgi:hypothetical protein